MIANREYSVDDYLAILKRRLRTVLIPALLAPVAGFLVSYAFPPKYTSQSLVLVEGQRVPEGVVQPVITSDLADRVSSSQQRILSRSRLLPLVEQLGLAKGSRTADNVIADIRSNLNIEPVVTDAGQIPDPTGGKKRSNKPGAGAVPGFSVNCGASNPKEARDICTALTSMLIEENIKSREGVTAGTTEFINSQLAQAKASLDDQDTKLAEFKKQYAGQLPGDEDNNLKVLATLESQLDANTQTISRAQQDKAYAETALAQQVAAWKSSQGSTNPQSLQMQLTNLQSQLLSLQARYTDDHPDVIKAKADIAQIKQKLAEVNSATADPDASSEKAGLSEPPEIRQLRLQVHQYVEVLAQATREQKRLSDQIRMYQSRVAVSPEVEAKYKQLTRDYDTAQKLYADLLTKKSTSETAQDLESRQLGEQMRLVNPASYPTDPSFPNRILFAAGGLGGGLALGLGLAFWLELRDKSIRDERDVEASLQMPVLVAIPWVTDAEQAKNGTGSLWSRGKKSGTSPRESVGA